MLASIVLSAAVAQGSLPSSWIAIGDPVEGAQRAGQYCVDDKGRFVYSQEKEYKQYDLQTGNVREFYSWFGPQMSRLQQPTKWSAKIGTAWGKNPVAGLSGIGGDWSIVKARRDLVLARTGSHASGWNLEDSFFLAPIGGTTTITYETGRTPLWTSGFDAVVPWWLQGKSDFAPAGRRDPVPARDILMVWHNGKSIKVKIPSSMSSCDGIPGGVLWTKGEVVVVGQRGHATLIRNIRTHPTFRSIPDPPLPAMPRGVLADGTICATHGEIPDLPSKNPSDYTTQFFDLKSWKWRSIQGLIIYGVSDNGKYVLYGWYSDRYLHMARIIG